MTWRQNYHPSPQQNIPYYQGFYNSFIYQPPWNWVQIKIKEKVQNPKFVRVKVRCHTILVRLGFKSSKRIIITFISKKNKCKLSDTVCWVPKKTSSFYIEKIMIKACSQNQRTVLENNQTQLTATIKKLQKNCSYISHGASHRLHQVQTNINSVTRLPQSDSISNLKLIQPIQKDANEQYIIWH